MTQLDLKLSGFNLPEIIDFFENKTHQYRWVPAEIATVIRSLAPRDQALIDRYEKSKEFLYYRDELIEDLKKL